MHEKCGHPVTYKLAMKGTVGSLWLSRTLFPRIHYEILPKQTNMADDSKTSCQTLVHGKA